MKCTKCGKNEENPYVVKNGKYKGKIQSHCRECNKKNATLRKQTLKKECVDYKGGKCCICGYDKYIGSLDFHHLDPSQKGFEFSHLKITSFKKNEEKLKKELDKCILVCRNCHAEIHAGILVPENHTI